MLLKKSISLMALALVAGVLAGCIREDRSDCPCDVFLDFVYTGDGDTDIFPDKIDRVNMYIYRASDKSLAGELVLDSPVLDREQGTHLSLSPGDYRIVCWGNVMENTQVETSYDEARVAEPVMFRGTEQFTGTDPLYFSELEISVPESLQDVHATCKFESAHIDMYVHLKGFRGAFGPDAAPDARISFSHSGCPAYTDFFNNPSDGQQCDVFPELMEDPEDEESYILVYNVLRFSEQDENRLVITDPSDGSEIYSLSVSRFLADHGIGVDGIHEAVVPVRIILGPYGIQTVEWNIEDVKPGFD